MATVTASWTEPTVAQSSQVPLTTLVWNHVHARYDTGGGLGAETVVHTVAAQSSGGVARSHTWTLPTGTQRAVWRVSVLDVAGNETFSDARTVSMFTPTPRPRTRVEVIRGRLAVGA